MGTFEKDFEASIGTPPPAHLRGPLRDYWDQPVARLCDMPRWCGAEAENERQRVYCYLLMALVYAYWNGFRYGRAGEYRLNDKPGPADPVHMHRDYYGHNIAALAVDERGHILDFEFNHNETFSSSAEHAEARLIRRLYELSGISDTWESGQGPEPAAVPPGATNRPYVTLRGVTVYTSLESCSQCAGIMALATVRSVVYLQTDPGMYWIGRLLYNLTEGTMKAPLPISGGEIGLPHFGELDQAFDAFTKRDQGKQPFWIAPTGDARPNIAVTSFLCTSAARRIFREGGKQLTTIALGNGDFRPFCGWWPGHPLPHSCGRACALSNAEVLAEARQFLNYAVGVGRRGTPHKG